MILQKLIIPSLAPDIHNEDDRVILIAGTIHKLIMDRGIDHIEIEAKLGSFKHNLDQYSDQLAVKLVDHLLNKKVWDVLPPANITGAKALYRFEPGVPTPANIPQIN